MNIYLFMIGSCIGSFANVLIWRLPRQLNYVTERSMCTKCHHRLAWYDMIPVISWLLLRGKCRYCGKQIAYRYPLVEICGGLCALFCMSYYEDGIQGMSVFLFLMTLLVIACIDADTMIIDHRMLIVLSLIGWTLCDSTIPIRNRLIASLIVSLPMLIMNQLITDCFGGGDIKLMAVCGFVLGVADIILAMCLAVMLGGISAIRLLYRKKAKRTSRIAFGPYLAIGIAVSLCFGSQLITWYSSLFY